MKRGFTLIELLVASALMALLITILTMVFNQSQIAWRTGLAGVTDLDEVRDNIAAVRDEADNAYVWNNEMHRIVGLWDENGNLRKRAWDAKDATVTQADQVQYIPRRGEAIDDSSTLKAFKPVNVGVLDSPQSVKTYTINVKSAGPNRRFDKSSDDDSDDIWSYPDEIRF